MRHPKSTSHSVAFVVVAHVGIALGMAAPTSIAGCAPPGRDQSGTAGATGAAGTGNGGGTTGNAGTGGTATGGVTGGGTTGTGGIVAAGRGGAGGTGGSGGATGGAAGVVGIAGANWGGSSGTGTAGGGAGGGSGGTGGTMPPRGPTPAADGVNFPFPQNRHSTRCAYPAGYLNSDVLAAYAKWKTDTVTTNGANGFRRIQRTPSDPVNMYTPAGSTVSEGISYGMLLSVYMGTREDQMLFDDLWRYSQAHLNANGLMHWAIAANGTTITGMGGATDADEDIAFALVMADRQWGSTGALNYLNLARTQITSVWDHEIIDSKLAGPGDSWGPTNLWHNINISYFAPAFYRVFKQVDPGHDWDAVIKTTYDTIFASLTSMNGNLDNGLVPAWCASNNNMISGSQAGPYWYQYDSCRTPFRIALDWCWFGETRARDYLMKTSNFFSGIGAANIVDGYELTGAKKVQFSPAMGTPTLAQQSAAFLGPSGVGAMVGATYQTFINDIYARLVPMQANVGGAYYDESWAVMSLLMMTGNMLNYTAETPLIR